MGEKHSQPFAHGDIVYTMNFPDPHTFSKEGRRQLFPIPLALLQENEDFFDRHITLVERCVHHDFETKVPPM